MDTADWTVSEDEDDDIDEDESSKRSIRQDASIDAATGGDYIYSG